jgi:anti-sigma-K factor RskA
MDYGRPELADRLAAGYVTGTLRGPARRRLEGLLPAHPTLRAAVLAWQARLMPLTTVLAPETPPRQVWERIRARIEGANEATAARPGGFAGLAFWRGIAAFASVAALGLAVLLASPAPVQAPVIVVLSNAAGTPGGAVPAAAFVAGISGDGRALVTRPLLNVALQADRALELWAIPPGGAPRSLGVISPSGATVVQKGKALEGARTLAVTLEPPGGSPSGAPTGPVLYSGQFTL